MGKLIDNRPVFGGGDLKQWATQVALPWLVKHLGLSAGVVCGSLDPALRREVYGLGVDDQLPDQIDWSQNGIIISPPGTGKGMAIFVEALNHFRKVYVLVPSVVQAHKLEGSLDFLYHKNVGGCQTSQRKSKGLIIVITTGILHQMIRNKNSDLWKEDTVLIIDEAQRVIDGDLLTQFMVGVAAQQGMRVMIVSATIAPGTLPRVYGHGAGQEANVYELNKQMHPIDIKVISGTDFTKMYEECPAFRTTGKTILLFAPSRRQIVGTVKSLNKQFENITAIAVTGAHIVEEQISMIERAQATGKTVVVVGTPGTMDSSVTIPGLSIVGIIDNRLEIDWNQWEVTERRNQNLPINHIVQMMRRVGRQRREDEKKDTVYIFSNSSREDVLVEDFTFDTLKGCSPWSPLEDLLLEAINLDISFEKIHDYMVSDFTQERIEKALEGVMRDGMAEYSYEEEDRDGFLLTERGKQVVALPYAYKWSQVIVSAPRELQSYLIIAASFGRLAGFEMFENEQKYSVATDDMSEVVRKIRFGVGYIMEHHDTSQRYFAESMDLSFRRLEQMESLVHLGCRALMLDLIHDIKPLSPSMREDLISHLVVAGLDSGLFQLFFAGKTKKGWSDVRRTPDMEEGYRKFFLDPEGVKLEKHSDVGVTIVVGTPQWFTARGGQKLGNVDNVTIVPQNLVKDLVTTTYALEQRWIELDFTSSEYRGKVQMEAEKDGVRYIASWVDNQPAEGMPYWCSVDKTLRYGVKTVFVHCKVC